MERQLVETPVVIDFAREEPMTGVPRVGSERSSQIPNLSAAGMPTEVTLPFEIWVKYSNICMISRGS